jgi:hypothetical protein
VYSPTRDSVLLDKHTSHLSSVRAKMARITGESQVAEDSVLPSKAGVLPNDRRCTPQQMLVYSPTIFSVLLDKKWCTTQQI